MTKAEAGRLGGLAKKNGHEQARIMREGKVKKRADLLARIAELEQVEAERNEARQVAWRLFTLMVYWAEQGGLAKSTLESNWEAWYPWLAKGEDRELEKTTRFR